MKSLVDINFNPDAKIDSRRKALEKKFPKKENNPIKNGINSVLSQLQQDADRENNPKNNDLPDFFK